MLLMRLEVHLIVINLMKQQVHFIDLFGWSFVIQGRDIKLGEKNLEQFRNFTNKLYNASNFLSLNVDTFPDLKDINIQTPLGLYMQSKLSHAVDEVRNSLDSYKFNEAASTLYRFVWMEFCDWGIEYSKASKESIVELGSLFKETLFYSPSTLQGPGCLVLCSQCLSVYKSRRGDV